MTDWNHGGGNDDFNWDLEVEYDFSFDVELYFDTDTSYYSDFDPNASVDVCVDIEGNFAGFNIDVQAVGDDSATEVNLGVVTTEEYSSITVSGYSAVA